MASCTTALSQKTLHNYCQGLSNVPVPDNKNVGFYFPLVFAKETNNLLTCSSDADDKPGPAQTPSNASHLQMKLRELRHIFPNTNMNAESAYPQAAGCSRTPSSRTRQHDFQELETCLRFANRNAKPYFTSGFAEECDNQLNGGPHADRKFGDNPTPSNAPASSRRARSIGLKVRSSAAE